jgi:hypothetical protein
MKEPIQQIGQEVSIVIYDSPLPPRYLRFSKKFIRTLFVVVPLSLGIIVIGLLLAGLGSRLRDTPAPSFPSVLSGEEAKVIKLENEIKSLTESNQKLQEKLSSQGTVGAPTADEPFLMGIKKPYGMQNLMSEKKVTLDQFELVQDQNKTIFKFQIISTNTETKVSGHVLVFMISESGLMAYPSEANTSIGGGVKFSMGEPFSVSRLRPTNAEYLHRLAGESVKFVIYIFSREGDLLLIKETESYKFGAKS